MTAFAYALMIRGGIPTTQVEPYLHQCAWFIERRGYFRVINAATGELLRELILDRSRDYQGT